MSKVFPTSPPVEMPGTESNVVRLIPSALRRSRWLHLAALFLLYIGLVAFRASIGFSSPHYEPGEWAPFYPAEAAIQYRWASRIAAGEELPKVDFRLQHPEGLRRWTDITPLLEETAGRSYRLIVAPFGAIGFLEFSIWFIAAVSALPVLVAWGLGTVIGRSRTAGWLGAVLLAVHPLGLERVVRNFGRENLALVFVFLPLLGLAAAWEASRAHKQGLTDGSWNRRVVAGIVVAVVAQVLAFAAWHLSRTFFEITVVLLVLMALTRLLTAAERRVTAVWLLCLLPACLLIPALRVRGFVVSPGVLFGHLLILNELLKGRIRDARLRLPLILLPVLGAAFWLRPAERDSHVLAVIAAKVRFLLAKPSDPALLSPEARVMWIEAFHSPDWVQALTCVVPLLVLLLVSVTLGWNRVREIWRESAGMRLLAIQTLTWGAAFVFVYRMHVVFLFNLCVMTGILAACVAGRWRRGLVLAVSAVVLLFFGWQSATFLTGNAWNRMLRAWNPPQQVEAYVNLRQDTVDLLNWIREETPRDAVFAGWFGLSSLIYAYADRPVVVQSKFENPTVRGKVEQLAAALYGPEQSLAEFCRRYGATYVVYEVPFLLSRSIDSVRYVAGHQRINADMVVYKMHFRPYELENFELVYQNGGFRVFEFLKSSHQQYRNLPIGWEAIYEQDLFGVRGEEAYDDRKTSAGVMAARQLEFARLAAEGLAAEGRYQEAKRLLEPLLSSEPRYWQGWMTLAKAARQAGDLATVRRAAAGILKGHPGHPEARRMLGAVEGPGSQTRSD